MGAAAPESREFEHKYRSIVMALSRYLAHPRGAVADTSLVRVVGTEKRIRELLHFSFAVLADDL